MTSKHDLADQLLVYARANNVLLPDHIVQTVRNATPQTVLTRWLAEALRDPYTETQASHPQAPRPRRSSPQAHSGRRQDRIGEGQGNSDTWMQNELNSLRSDTRCLDQQTRTLTLQAAALRAPFSTSGQGRTDSSHQGGQISHVQIHNDGLTSSVKSELETSHVRLEKEARALPAVVSERLKTDDRLLKAILVQAEGFNTTSTDDLVATSARLQNLAFALHKKRAEALKDKLDALYLSTSTEESPRALEADETAAAAKEVAQVKNDITTLYTEIDDVVTMLIGQEHMIELESIVSTLENRDRESRMSLLRRARDSLEDMIKDVAALTHRAQAIKAQRRALSEIEGHIERVQLEGKTRARHFENAPSGAVISGGFGVAAVGDFAAKVGELEALLCSAVARRQRAIDTLPNIDYGEEIAKVEALEQRIARAKSTLETLSNPRT